MPRHAPAFPRRLPTFFRSTRRAKSNRLTNRLVALLILRASGATPFDHKIHRLDANIFQRAQRIDQFSIHQLNTLLMNGSRRRHIRQFQPLADLFEVHRQLVGQVNIAVHDTCHELDRMVRLQPAGLIADHRISGQRGIC